MSEEREARPRTDVERIEDALSGLIEVALRPGPDPQTQIARGIQELRDRLKKTEDEE